MSHQLQKRLSSLRLRAAAPALSLLVLTGLALNGCGGGNSGNNIPASNYTATDLGTLVSGGSSSATAINASGMVVGTATNSDGNPHGFLYSSGAIADLNTLATNRQTGFTLTSANAINDTGQVVGSASTSSGATHAFLYSASAVTDIGVFSGGGNSEAYGINASGQVVGYGDTSSSTSFGFLYSGGTLTNLGTISDGINSQANAINSGGVIVGRAFTSSGATRAFQYVSGAFTVFGPYFNGGDTVASAVNTNGQTAGYTFINSSNTTRHALLITNGGALDLGTLTNGTNSLAKSVNDNAQVVGNSDIGNGTIRHGFLYTKNTMYDLNNLVTSGLSGFTITDAAGINNSAWIAATGTDTAGHTHAFLLKPTN